MKKYIFLIFAFFVGLFANGQSFEFLSTDFAPFVTDDVPANVYPYGNSSKYRQQNSSDNLVIEAFYIRKDKKLRSVRVKVRPDGISYRIVSVYSSQQRRWINYSAVPTHLNQLSSLERELSEYFDYKATVPEYGKIYFNL
jgi:hypothetical protein